MTYFVVDTKADLYDTLRAVYLKWKLDTSKPCWQQNDFNEFERILHVLAES